MRRGVILILVVLFLGVASPISHAQSSGSSATCDNMYNDLLAFAAEDYQRCVGDARWNPYTIIGCASLRAAMTAAAWNAWAACKVGFGS